MMQILNKKVGDENVEEAHKEFQEETIKDFFEKVVACNFDGASVMYGKKGRFRAISYVSK